MTRRPGVAVGVEARRGVAVGVAAAKDRGVVAGDAATLRVIWDRAGHQAEPATAERVAAALAAMGTAADVNPPQGSWSRRPVPTDRAGDTRALA